MEEAIKTLENKKLVMTIMRDLMSEKGKDVVIKTIDEMQKILSLDENKTEQKSENKTEQKSENKPYKPPKKYDAPGLRMNICWGNESLLNSIHIQLLKGADPDKPITVEQGITERVGKIPIIQAIFNDNEKVIKLLADFKANLNIQDEDGNTPLIHALLNNNPKIALQLINAGANVNIPNYLGITPMMFLVGLIDYNFGNEVVLKMLLIGADVKSLDARGHDALFYAKNSIHEDNYKKFNEVLKTLNLL